MPRRKKPQYLNIHFKFKPIPSLIAGIILGLGAGFGIEEYRGSVTQPPVIQQQVLPVVIKQEELKIDVCFTPGQQCEGIVLETINQAKLSIHMQGYSFTSASIANALVAAKSRGVDVKLLIDRSQKTASHSQVPLLATQGIQVFIDKVPGIAHNKIIIIDNTKVVTGSYNWTAAANLRNAENLLLIEDTGIVARYKENWETRFVTSIPWELENVQPYPHRPSRSRLVQKHQPKV